MHFQCVSKLSWKKLEAVCEFEWKHLSRPRRRFPAGDAPFLLFRKKKKNSQGKTKGTVKTGLAVTPPPSTNTTTTTTPPPLFDSTDSTIATSWNISLTSRRSAALRQTTQVCRQSKRVESFAKNVVLFEGVGMKIPPAQTSFIPTHPFFKKKHLQSIAFIYFTIFFIFLCTCILFVASIYSCLWCVCWIWLWECVCVCM